ncbi:hypothetical protein ACPCG0_11700 [Propionibacteriaceae bacterium Y1923]|uniref:hypothetical protein n=1 Tax=Aestuariimicrobium sp. Y1814 TaxID=3418742 RepID=UPI003C28DFE5
MSTQLDAVQVITAMVKAYTRGNGFDAFGTVPNPDLSAVITMASARLAANPGQLRRTDTSGPFTQVLDGFQGWTLAELAVLNRYRERAL